MVVLVGGVLIFRHSGDGALGVVSLATFFTAFGVYHFLDERDKRRKGERPRRQ
jgi:preprotein translocase subunit SecG